MRKIKLTKLLFSLCMLMLTVQHSLQAETYPSENYAELLTCGTSTIEPTTTSNVTINPGLIAGEAFTGQSFVAPIEGGIIKTFTIWEVAAANGNNHEIRMYEGAGTSGTLLHSQAVSISTIPPVSLSFDLSGFTYTGGQTYTIGIYHPGNGFFPLQAAYGGDNTNPYADGEAYTQAGVQTGIDVRMKLDFKTITTPSNVATSAATTTTADFSWDMVPDATSYDWKVVADGAGVNGTQIDGGNVSTNAAAASGLTENTPYDFYVKAKGTCTGDAVESDWTLLDFTTLALSTEAPGGVASNLSLWLKADLGATSAQWDDQSTNNHDVTAVAGEQPALVTNGVNFNPAFDFDGANDQFTNMASPYPSGAADETNLFIVEANDVTGGSIFGFQDSPSNSNDKFHAHYPRNVNDVYFDISTSTGSNRVSGTYPFVTGEATIGGFFNSVTNNNQEININGTSVAQDATGVSQASSITRIGSAYLNGLGHYDGKIVEVVAFDSDLTPTEKQQVQSYLAIKYGITLGINYLASDGTTTIYDVSAYGNDVAGIGQDDDSALLQKQSKSVNSDAIVTMGLSTIETTNAANTATFAADKSFMLWGNDGNASTSFNSTGAPSGYDKLERTWKISETLTVGNVMLTVDVNDGDYDLAAFDNELYLLKGSDLSTATPVQMYDDGTNGDVTSGDGIWTLNVVDFADGDLFSFATIGCPNQVALAAVGGTVTATASCLEVNGWTYYFDSANPTNAVFAIEQKPSGGNTSDFEASVTISVTANPTSASGIYAVEDNVNQEGNFSMGRYWNVDVTSGSLNGAVNVRFFYDPAELAIIQSEATAFANAATPALNLSDPIWFKTVGSTYDPNTNTATTANSGNVIEFGNLTPAMENGVTYVEMTGVTSFSGGGVAVRASAMSAPALPVELTSFSGQEQNCSILLKWATASEEAFSHFEIERSIDGETFERISNISAEGGSSAQSYSQRDNSSSPKNYYRLRMVDLDGSYEYSKIIFVEKRCQEEINDLIIYPNPISQSNQSLNVKYSTQNDMVKLTLHDFLGRPIRQLNWETEIGENNLELDISDLPLSTYFLKIEDGINVQVKEFVKFN